MFFFLGWVGLGRDVFFFRRSTLVRAVPRLVQHLAGTRSVLFFLRYFFHSLAPDASVILRAPGGAVNLAVTLGSNMYAGAHARSTFPTRHPSHRVSTSPHHDNEQAFSARKKCYIFIFVVCCHGERDITGAYSLQERGWESYNKSHLRCSARANVSE